MEPTKKPNWNILEPTTPSPDFNPTLALAPANRCRMPPSVKGIKTGVAPEEETITFSCAGQQKPENPKVNKGQ